MGDTGEDGNCHESEGIEGDSRTSLGLRDSTRSRLSRRSASRLLAEREARRGNRLELYPSDVAFVASLFRGTAHPTKKEKKKKKTPECNLL